MLALFNDLGVPGAGPARVVRVERSHCVVACPDGAQRLATAAVLPAVGDWVAVRDDVVIAVLPRWSELARRDPDGASVQVLAANIDLVLITAPGERLSPARVERELAVAWESGAQPVVVMTKADLAGVAVPDELSDRLVGVDVVATSATTGAGVETIRAMLQPCRSAVLLGPSGAGKSTLANLLVGGDALALADFRADRRGRHTTTSRQLVCVPSGGVLIDTPGLRSLSLVGDGDGIAGVFPDIDALAARCRFRDCRHDTEPRCAVLAATQSGTLVPARLESYRKLERELAAEARRRDPLVRKAELSVWKARTKTVRAASKRKPRD
ncbi:ribosome small subunit-dependent GTPase A [soil metagenome]